MSEANTTTDTAAAGDILLRQDAGPVTTLTLNRPAQFNSLSADLLAALTGQLAAVGADDAIRVVVIAGAGKAFCAGHDLKEMKGMNGRDSYERLFEQCSRMMLSIVGCPKPVIARVHGVATAAGCQLVGTCDLAIASDNARFGTSGINMGLFCSTPMVALSRNVGRKKSMEMLLTGDLIDAPTAAEIGLINQAVPAETLDDAVATMAEKIAAKSAPAIRLGKAAFYKQIEMELADAYRHTAAVMADNMCTADVGEGLDAFIEKRPPNWTHE